MAEKKSTKRPRECLVKMAGLYRDEKLGEGKRSSGDGEVEGRGLGTPAGKAL